jgi:hypothetical protein
MEKYQQHYNPNVWGPHYWFFLHTISQTYPMNPTPATKRKYYDLIQNMPLFIPTPEIGNKFSDYLDKYPVSPYLDSRDSFVRWVIFIHNKMNASLNKSEISYNSALEYYNNNYKPKQIQLLEKMKLDKHMILMIYISLCLLLIFIIY